MFSDKKKAVRTPYWETCIADTKYKGVFRPKETDLMEAQNWKKESIVSERVAVVVQSLSHVWLLRPQRL